MLPIVAVPLVVKDFSHWFKSVFKRKEQHAHFEAFITALSVADNRTIAGIHQMLVDGATYESLHHFMTESPWSVDQLRDARLQYVKHQLVKKPIIQCLAMTGDHAGGALPLRNERQFPTIVAIDATFTHHTGEKIYGVNYYRDYAKRCYTLAQRLVISTLVTQDKLVPLGWKLYHRGFLEEQLCYLEEMAPEPDADEVAWAEYDKLIEQYEQNQEEHKTQNELAVELVEECEQPDLNVDAYVSDGALACPEIMDAIEKHGKAWVSKLAKSRLVQMPHGGFESIEAFARSIPKASYKPVNVKTRHGERRTYWCFSKCLMVHKWHTLRVVISYDNEKLDGDPIYFITNRTHWVQPQKILEIYMRRDSIEHLIRDGKQEIGLEDSQQRNEDGVRKHWELSFAAHTLLELGLEVPNLPGVPAVKLETIGQKSRVMEGALLQGFVDYVAQLVLEGKETNTLVWQIMRKRLNRLAT